MRAQEPLKHGLGMSPLVAEPGWEIGFRLYGAGVLEHRVEKKGAGERACAAGLGPTGTELKPRLAEINAHMVELGSLAGVGVTAGVRLAGSALCLRGSRRSRRCSWSSWGRTSVTDWLDGGATGV